MVNRLRLKFLPNSHLVNYIQQFVTVLLISISNSLIKVENLHIFYSFIVLVFIYEKVVH